MSGAGASVDETTMLVALVGSMDREHLQSLSVDSLVLLCSHVHGGVTIHTEHDDRKPDEPPTLCAHPGHREEPPSYKGKKLQGVLIDALLDGQDVVVPRPKVAPWEPHDHVWVSVRVDPGRSTRIWECQVPGCAGTKVTYDG